MYDKPRTVGEIRHFLSRFSDDKIAYCTVDKFFTFRVNVIDGGYTFPLVLPPLQEKSK